MCGSFQAVMPTVRWPCAVIDALFRMPRASMRLGLVMLRLASLKMTTNFSVLQRPSRLRAASCREGYTRPQLKPDEQLLVVCR